MSEWIEYTGSEKQIEEIDSDDNDILFRLGNGKVILDSEVNGYWLEPFIGVTHYLICQPHPYADLIKIWADTGCPVYAKHKATGQTDEVCGPRVDWNHEEWEFSLTPFED